MTQTHLCSRCGTGTPIRQQRSNGAMVVHGCGGAVFVCPDCLHRYCSGCGKNPDSDRAADRQSIIHAVLFFAGLALVGGILLVLNSPHGQISTVWILLSLFGLFVGGSMLSIATTYGRWGMILAIIAIALGLYLMANSSRGIECEMGTRPASECY